MTRISKNNWFFPGLIQVLLLSFACFTMGVLPASAQTGLSKEEKALFGKAQSLNNLERFEESHGILQPLYAAYPENEKIAVEFAKALGFSGQEKKALEILEPLSLEHPQDQEIKRLLAGIMEANERFRQSRAYYQQLYEKNPEDKTLLRKLADLSLWMHDYESAVSYYQQLLELEPGDAALKIQLADAYFYSAQYAQAQRLYHEAKITPQSHEQAYKNLAYSYFLLEDYEASLAAYRKLADQFPDDVEIKAALASVLYVSGRLEEAEKYFKEVIAANPQDVSAMLKLAEILSLRKEYDQAVEIFEKILAIKPKHKDAKIGLARVLSWDRQYDRSLALYAEIIDENPDWVIARRERARILGWQRNYKRSVEAYQTITAEGMDEEIVSAERQAKDAMYHHFDSSAIEQYENWLSLEPENLEALFDLGQLYARNKRWSEANQVYGKILSILPEHRKTQQAKQKIAHYSESLLAEGAFEFYEADSATRSADVKYYSIMAGVRAPLSENVYVGLTEKISFYEFSQSPTRMTRNRITTVLDYYRLPLFEARVGYARNEYSDGLGGSHNFFERFKLTPFDAYEFQVSHERRDIIDNALTLNAGLYTDDYRLRVVHTPNRRLQLGADHVFSHLSDGNDRHTYGVDLETLVFYEPRRLSFIYRYENYGYDNPSALYFSPSSFHTNIIGFEWEHFLNEEEMYWGSNDTYYTFRYLVNFDVNDQTGHTLFLRFHHDINNRSFVRLEASKKIYEHEKTYSEDRITAHAGIYF